MSFRIRNSTEDIDEPFFYYAACLARGETSLDPTRASIYKIFLGSKFHRHGVRSLCPSLSLHPGFFSYSVADIKSARSLARIFLPQPINLTAECMGCNAHVILLHERTPMEMFARELST